MFEYIYHIPVVEYVKTQDILHLPLIIGLKIVNSRACGSYIVSRFPWLLLTRKLLKQGFLVEVITSKVLHDDTSVSQITMNM